MTDTNDNTDDTEQFEEIPDDAVVLQGGEIVTEDGIIGHVDVPTVAGDGE